MPTPPLPAPGTRIANRYVVESVDARSGLCRATDTLWDRTVSLRLLPASLPDRVRARVARDAEAAAAVEHPHLLRVLGHDADPEGGWDVVATEPVAAQSLADLTAQRGAPPAPLALRIVQEAAAGLGAAHAAGVAHGALHPGLLLLVRDAGSRRMAVRVAGLALPPEEPAEGGVPPHAPYASPERLRREEPTPAADVWSLGVVAYELFAGLPGDWIATLGALARRRPARIAPPREVRPGVAAAVSAAIERALAPDPADRWPDAAAFAAALAGAAAERPERARPAAPPAAPAASAAPPASAGVATAVSTDGAASSPESQAEAEAPVASDSSDASTVAPPPSAPSASAGGTEEVAAVPDEETTATLPTVEAEDDLSAALLYVPPGTGLGRSSEAPAAARRVPESSPPPADRGPTVVPPPARMEARVMEDAAAPAATREPSAAPAPPPETASDAAASAPEPVAPSARSRPSAPPPADPFREEPASPPLAFARETVDDATAWSASREAPTPPRRREDAARQDRRPPSPAPAASTPPTRHPAAPPARRAPERSAPRPVGTVRPRAPRIAPPRPKRRFPVVAASAAVLLLTGGGLAWSGGLIAPALEAADAARMRLAQAEPAANGGAGETEDGVASPVRDAAPASVDASAAAPASSEEAPATPREEPRPAGSDEPAGAADDEPSVRAGAGRETPPVRVADEIASPASPAPGREGGAGEEEPAVASADAPPTVVSSSADEPEALPSLVTPAALPRDATPRPAAARPAAPAPSAPAVRAPDPNRVYGVEELDRAPSLTNGGDVMRAIQRGYSSAASGFGTVHMTVSFVVGTDGRVDDGSVFVPQASLSDIVRRGLARARFRPAMVDGRPVRARVSLPLTWVAEEEE